MSRKRSHYRPRGVSAPMLVNRGLQETTIETHERMLVEAFAGGWATTRHYDDLVDMRNVLTIAGAYQKDASVEALNEPMRMLFANLRERYERTGRMGASGDELQMLRVFVGAYRDFWIRQPVSLYQAACDELTRFHAGLPEAA